MMCQHVGVQIGLLVEPLVTALEVAQEGLFSSVNSEVSLKVKV